MEDAVLGPNGWECDPTRGPYKVYADVDPVTGGIGYFTANGKNQYLAFPATTDPLGLIGDSRTENGGYFCPAPSAASLSGSVLSVTAAFLGAQAAVGSTIVLSHNGSKGVLSTSYNFIVATVASVVDINNITANVVYPSPTALSSGALSTNNSKCMIDCNYPNYSSSPQAWVLALRNKAYRQVYSAAFNGARVQDAITHQVPYLISKGCKEFWIYIGINDILATVDNYSSTYLIEKYKELYSMLRGNKVVHFLEEPCGSGLTGAASNRQRVLDVNAWINANAASYGVNVFDAWTPLNDPSNSGYAAAGMLIGDGLHFAQKGSMAVGLASIGHPAFPTAGLYAASAADVGTALQPVPNPMFWGTVGASQTATGYGGSATGVVLGAYGINLLADGFRQEQYVNVTSSASGQSYSFNSANFTVIPGQKYRISMTVELIGGVAIDYIQMQLLQHPSNTKYGDVWMGANTGSGDGSYVLTASSDYVCNAALTTAKLQAIVAFSGAGGAQIKYRNWEMRAI